MPKVSVRVVKGISGRALYINNTLVAGHKPWGGGTLVCAWQVDPKDIAEALKSPKPDTKFKTKKGS